MRFALALLAAALFALPAFAQQPAPPELVELLEKLPRPPGAPPGQEHTRSGLPTLYTLGAEALRDDPALKPKAQAVFERYRADAEAGDPIARASLSRLYRLGSGVAQSEVIAFNWMRIAAEQGHPDGEGSLAYYYYNGLGTPKNREEAVRWARAAAEHGDAYGRALYGVLLMTGNPPSYAQALGWLRMAAAQGQPYAHINIADAYRKGLGVPKDPSSALEHMRTALKIMRDGAAHPVMTEDVRRYMVQAQAAIRDKQFAEAQTLLDEARNRQPWLPMAWYNTGLLQSELGHFDEARWSMQVFLVLAPDAPQARGAQDLIYEWERKLPK